MKKSTSETSILKDMAVFDYVAGHQVDNVRSDFEKLLEQDSQLNSEVLAEKKLRETLENSSHKANSSPVSMKNFDALLERIDQLEGKSFDDAASNPSQNNVVSMTNWRWQKSFSIAASFAVIAMIGFIGFNQTTKPEFVTLSDKVASADVDFDSLAEQNRLVKLSFSDGLTTSEIADFLESHQLSSIHSGTNRQEVFASSLQTLDQNQLAVFSSDRRIVVAQLVSYDAK